MKEEEYRTLYEEISYGIAISSLKSYKKGRSLLVGTFRPGLKEDESDTLLVHHIYLEDEHIHSVVYDSTSNQPINHDVFIDTADPRILFRANFPFVYVPEFCDYDFCRKLIQLHITEKLQFRRWKGITSDRKGAYRARLIHELHLPTPL